MKWLIRLLVRVLLLLTGDKILYREYKTVPRVNDALGEILVIRTIEWEYESKGYVVVSVEKVMESEHTDNYRVYYFR